MGRKTKNSLFLGGDVVANCDLILCSKKDSVSKCMLSSVFINSNFLWMLCIFFVPTFFVPHQL